MINRVILLGNVGSDPTFFTTSTGKSIASFPIATEIGKGDNKRTTWNKVEVWNKLAEIVRTSVTKGSLIYVEGHLVSSSYQNSKGQMVYKTVVTGNELRFLHKKSSETVIEKDETANETDIGVRDNDDNIPF